MDSKTARKRSLTVFDLLGLDFVVTKKSTKKQCSKVFKQSSTKYLRFVLEGSTTTLGLEKQVLKGAQNRRQFFMRKCNVKELI